MSTISTSIAQQFGMTEALQILGVKAINDGTSTGQNNFANGEILESHSPVDGQLIAKVRGQGLELKCKRCKRIVVIPFTSIEGWGTVTA